MTKTRETWIYTIEMMMEAPSGREVGVLIVEDRVETTAAACDTEAKMVGCWRTDERVLDESKLREWVDTMHPAGIRRLAVLRGFEVLRSRAVPMPSAP